MSAHDDELMRFIDGAMSADEAAAFEQTLAEDPALLADRDAFAFTGQALRGMMAAEVEAADFGDFWRLVEEKLPDAPLPAPREAAPTAAVQAGLGARIAGWWRSYWTPVLVSAAAAAAVAWFVSVRSGGDEVTGGQIIVEGVENEGPQTVLISQPEDDGGATVIWLLDEEHETDGEGTSPDDGDPI